MDSETRPSEAGFRLGSTGVDRKTQLKSPTRRYVRNILSLSADLQFPEI